MLLSALTKYALTVNSTLLKHSAPNMMIEFHSTEAVIITKKKDEGKRMKELQRKRMKLARFHADSTSCFITRNNLGL